MYPGESSAVVAVTPDGAVVGWNPAAERLFGRQAAEVFGRNISTFIPAGELLKVVDRVRRLQRAEKLDVELPRNGASWLASLTVSPAWWDAQGRVTALSIAAEDVEERRRQETFSRRLLHAFEHTSTAVAITDEGGVTHDLVNPAYARMHGYEVEELRGRPVRDVFPPECHARLEEETRRTDARDHYVFESKHVRKDGAVFPVLVDATRVRGPDGRALYRVMSVHDLSTVKWLERMGHDAQAAARRLESAFAGALDGLLVADKSGRIVLANERAALIFAVPKDELLIPMRDYAVRFKLREAADDRPAVPLGQRALAGETVGPLERIIVAGDGSERFLRTGASPLRDEAGRIEGAVIVIADVTDEKRAREALRAGEAKYRELVEGIDAIVWEADAATWEFTYVNRCAERILGYPVERWLSEKDFWVRILHPEDRDAATRCCTQAVAAGRDNDFEYRVIAADGRVVWIRDLVYVTTDESGRARRLRGIMFDVTESRRAREALHASEGRERARVEELRTVLESTPAVIWIAHDPDGRRITGNRAAYELLRLPYGVNASVTAPEGEAPTHFRVFSGGRELAPEEYPVQRAARGEEIRDFEEEIVFDDGVRVRILGNAVPIRDAAGAPRGAVAAFVDITERVRADAKVRELNQTLEARVEERTRDLRLAINDLNAFAYTVAHDLRAPLRAMHGFSDLLREEYRTRAIDERGLGYLDRIGESSKQMDALIRGLLEYSRLGRVEQRLEPVDLEPVIVAALGQMRAEIDKSKGEVLVRGSFPRAKGNRLLLIQALANLLSNRVKFVAPGVRPRIEIGAEEAGDRVRLSVKDNGIGIDPGQRERVFGVFERLHPPSAYPGTGIGLAIVRRAVERMGGRTGVESAPGAGSTFWIELPKEP